LKAPTSSTGRALLKTAMIASAGLIASAAPAQAQANCSSVPLAVQVLGSGGPHTGTRASSGYLVWRNGRAVVMVDAGGGTFLRFGEAGAQLADLALLAISHLHPDHVADLPALLWLSELSRQQPLKIAGPSGTGAFPPFDTFISRLFDSGNGVFPILAGTLGQVGQGVRLDITTVDAGVGKHSTVFSADQLEVSAIGVPHANVPSIAYRIRVDNRTIVFGSDQNGSDSRFSAFASDADLLVMHLSLSEHAPQPLAQIHARPATVGQIARNSKAKRLVLSHFIEAPAEVKTREWFSLWNLDQVVADVRKHFTGPVDTAADLQCIPVP
jgi:ribonuclease BN (tRNA processing enzyme)